MTKRFCKRCGTPEVLSFGGLYTNLSPYSQLCPKCLGIESSKNAPINLRRKFKEGKG